MKELFNLGRVVATSNAMEHLESHEIHTLITRHITGDFGVDKNDTNVNLNAIKTGKERIFSAYTVRGEKIYVITEWDRSVTTVLLASDY